MTEKERRQIIEKATRGLTLDRDKIEKISFYTARRIQYSRDRLSAYIAIPDGEKPYLRVVPAYYGERWLFVKEIKVMADNNVVYDKPLPSSSVKRDNGSEHVWESADYAAEAPDELSLRVISSASKATIRFVGNDHVQDFDLSKGELGNIKRALAAYDALQKL